MLNIQRLSLVVSICALAMPGCGSGQGAKDVWKTTKSYYNEYVNTPAVLSLDDTGNNSDYELALGAAMTDIDQKLRQLIRAMDDSDRGINNDWVNAMARRFPWLSGIAVVNGQGEPLARVPDFDIKEFDVKPLLVEDPKQKRASLRAYVQKSPLGPEIYLAKPVYVDNALQAMVIAHFDMRALMATTANPELVAVFSTNGKLWSAVYDIDSTPLKDADWGRLVKNNTKGTLSNKIGTFYWSSMYFANLPIVYAIPSKGNFPLKPEQLEELRGYGTFGSAPPRPVQAAPVAPPPPAPLRESVPPAASEPPAEPVREATPMPAAVPADEPVQAHEAETLKQSEPEVADVPAPVEEAREAAPEREPESVRTADEAPAPVSTPAEPVARESVQAPVETPAAVVDTPVEAAQGQDSEEEDEIISIFD